MSSRQQLIGVVVVAAVVAAFGAGYLVGGGVAAHPPVYVADGYVGADQASFEVGDTTYGFESTVSWTDSAGAFHDGGWPDCLPKLQQVKGVRFAASTVWFGNVGVAHVQWVDCQPT